MDRPNADHAVDAADGQRRDERDSLFVLAGLRPEGAGEFVNVRVRNVSSGGLMAQAGEVYRTAARVEVRLEGLGTVAGSVAWAEAGRIGIAFDHPVDKARARKTVAKDGPDILHHSADYRRPPIRTR